MQILQRLTLDGKITLKADLETLKMKLQTVEHSLSSDIDILRKELAILKNAREADMATMMSKDKAGNPGKTHPNQKPDQKTENPSASTDSKLIKKGNSNTIEIVEEKISEPSTRDSSTESSMKENIDLQKENKELKERICILDRVIEEILDHQQKRNEEENPWETRKKATLKRRLPDYQPTLTSHTTNRFEYLSDMETDTDVETDFIPLNHRRTRNTQPRRGSRNQGNYEKSSHYHNQGKKTSQKQIKERTRKRILIIGDSQLHAIDSNKMTRTHDVKVRSQGGLKLEQMENLLRQEIKYNPDEVIAHVGVNNIEFESEEDILDKFANISDSFYDMTKLTFSGIIRRSDKPFLNQKIDSINCQLEKMCLNKGHDFIDNNNVKFGHLNRGGLHINPTGQKRLAMNFITQIKSSG